MFKQLGPLGLNLLSSITSSLMKIFFSFILKYYLNLVNGATNFQLDIPAVKEIRGKKNLAQFKLLAVKQSRKYLKCVQMVSSHPSTDREDSTDTDI